jgi:hypothetical protein
MKIMNIIGALTITTMVGCEDSRVKASPREILSQEQVERRIEYNLRDIRFKQCDLNENGMLEYEEYMNYKKLPIFNHRFQ